jgi:pectate lyase
MKKLIFTLMAAAMTASSTAQSVDTESLSAYDQNVPIGWATIGEGVTGSNDENPVTVETREALIAALAGTTPKTIYVKGTILFTGLVSINGAQNKTVYGLPGAVLANPDHSTIKAESGILQLKNCKNIILRNLTFKGAGAYDMDGSDNLELQGSTYIWVDHCDFQDGVDGNLDCNNGSDNICISWCRFHYLIAPWSGGSGGSNDHRYTNLWGGGDKNAAKDEGKLRTTFANCWWDEGCKERMPRIRFGQVHLLNCLYSSSVANYCVGGGYRSNAYIEKCAFTSNAAKKYPWKNYATSGTFNDYNYTITSCLGATDKQTRYGSIDYFIPSEKYSYESYDAALVQSVVSNSSNGAGATLKFTDPTAIQESASVADIVKVEYFSLDGSRLTMPRKGIAMQVVTKADGTKLTRKITLSK